MKDRNAVNHNIRKHFNELIYNTARYTEIALSIVIIIVIALSGLRLILTTAGTSIMDMDTSFFTSFLSQALSLVVGVEFVKMLCRHSAQTVVEVLLFATARQMVVEHLDPVQTLIGIIGIAILFAIRKYLMTDSDDMTPHQKNASEESSKKASLYISYISHPPARMLNGVLHNYPYFLSILNLYNLISYLLYRSQNCS